MAGFIFYIGHDRNRTGDKGFADLCLTAWLRDQEFLLSQFTTNNCFFQLLIDKYPSCNSNGIW